MASNTPRGRTSDAPRDADPFTLPGRQRVLVTGGAGFIGSNLARRLLAEGHAVHVYDSLARPGVETNLGWLHEAGGDRLSFTRADIRDRRALRRAVDDVDVVCHLAAQVAVTTSVVDPIEDFEVNARGTLEVLEAIRARSMPPVLLYTSTNKVYGALPDVVMHPRGDRYVPADAHVARHGIDESRPLDLHSPYGCSKGAADQYVLDYTRTYGLPAVVFRMSCIYGPRQFGTEDQGWLAHFLFRALGARPVTVYGTGRQVRDVLYVDDLVDAMLGALAAIDRTGGRAFNVGGGPGNTLSLNELIRRVERLHARPLTVEHQGWRTGDQRYYVSDPRALGEAIGWRPRTDVETGLARLDAWTRAATGAAAPIAHRYAGAHP